MKYIIQEHSILGGKLPKHQKIKVIGAGISGLMAGFYLKKRGYDFEIIEQSKKTGGLLGTQELKEGLVESGANGFIWCPELQEVADDLGLELMAPDPLAKKRFLVRNKKLYRYPLKVRESLKMTAKAIWPHRQKLETAADFGDTYFGKAFTNHLLGPGLAGIYAANPQQLSFPGALSRIAKMMNQSDLLPLALFKSRDGNSENPNKAKGRAGTHSFAGGMEDLVAALTKHLEAYLTYETDGLALKAAKENLLITIPAYQSKHFFKGPLFQMLDQVQYTPLISSTFFFKREDLTAFQNGFGCLIPRTEGLVTLGILFNSCIFPNRSASDDLLSLTCILRDDSPNLDLLASSDAAIEALIVKELDQLFKLRGKPVNRVIKRWPKAIPVYSPELYHNWFEMDRLLKADYPNRHLFGNYTGEISVRALCQTASKIGL